MSVHWHMATWDRLCERCEKRPALPTDEYCEECLQNMSESAYERSLSDCYRGNEAASALAEEQARVQRELK